MPPLVRVLLLALAVVVPAGGAPGDIGLAVVRGDARLQPLATFTADAWAPLAAADAAGGWSLWLFDDPVVKTSPFAARSARAVSAAAGAAGSCLPLSNIEAGSPSAWQAARRRQPSPVGLALRGTDVRPDLPVAVAADSELGTQITARAGAAFPSRRGRDLDARSRAAPGRLPALRGAP